MLAGCNDLPDANYPLLPTPVGDVVSPDDGRGSYDWKLENGKFRVEQSLDSNIFLSVDDERVRAMMRQACTNPPAPAYQPPEWIDDMLRRTIDACIHRPDKMPGRIVSMTTGALPHTVSQSARLALDQQGSRLLIVEDTLTLWDTNRGQLLKELPSPTREPRFVFMGPAGDQAFIFDSHQGYRLSFEPETTSAAKVSQREIQQVVASDQRDVFFVRTESDVIQLNADLQAVSAPNLSLGDEGLLSVSADGDCVATFDRGEFSLFNLASSAPPLSLGVGRNAPVRKLIAAPESNLLAVFAHDIRSIVMGPIPARRRGLMNNLGSTVACRTALSIDRCLAQTDKDDPLSPWIAVCVERPATENNASDYVVYDVNVDDGLVSLPTVIDSRRPELFTMSGDGRVLATASPNGPVSVHFRGPRLIEHAELDALIEAIAGLILTGRHNLAEELIESLEDYAASAPYTLGTRQLLDLQSEVAKRLVIHSLKDGTNALKSELDAWLETRSPLAKLVQATHLASRQLNGGQEAWDQNNAKLRALVDEILTDQSPPGLAFEILASLTWAMKLDAGPLSTHFAAQFERDPLNPYLHLSMASYHAIERAGDTGQPVAYLEAVCRYLPSEHRDAFYSLYALKIQQALMMMSSVPGAFPPLPFAISGNNVPQIYDLSSGPYKTIRIRSQGALRFNESRLVQGLKDLLKPNSLWEQELPQSLWSELPTAIHLDRVFSSSEFLVDGYLRLYPFSFNDVFTVQMGSAFQKKLPAAEQ